MNLQVKMPRLRHLWPTASLLVGAFLLMPLLLAGEVEGIIARGTPEEVNLKSEVLSNIDGEIKDLVNRNVLPGSIVLITRHGKLIYESVVGYPSDDMIFRLFSMSKPVTAAAVLLLVQEGLMQLEDPIGMHIPELANLEVIKGRHSRPNWYDTEPPRHQPTVRNLLTHTAGFAYGFSNTTVDALYRRTNLRTYLKKGETLQEFVEKLARLPLLYHPGEHWWYSVSFDVAGYLIEKVSGKPLDVFMRERLFEPLGMRDTGFYVPLDQAHRLAPWVMASGDPENAWRSFPDADYIGNNYLEDPELKLAGAGLVSTAMDYLRFCQMLLDGGVLEGKRILRADLVEGMLVNQLPKKLMPFHSLGETFYNEGFTLGSAVQLLSTGWGPAGEVTWGGQANTKFLISKQFDTVIIAMTQKSPFPNQVADVARKWLYQSARDVPPPTNDPNLVEDKWDRMTTSQLNPVFKSENPFWREATDQQQVAEESDEGSEAEEVDIPSPVVPREALPGLQSRRRALEEATTDVRADGTTTTTTTTAAAPPAPALAKSPPVKKGGGLRG